MPYDILTMERMRKQKEDQIVDEAHNYPDPMEELKKHKDLDMDALKVHLDKFNRQKFQQ